jgi:hypothetical protein
MKVLLAGGAAVVAAAAVAVWLFLGVGHAADAGKPVLPGAESIPSPGRLIVHEWGTFTSFSGSDGVPVGFYPNNNDLPGFVYNLGPYEDSKSSRFIQGGTVSMETPVIYFYTDRPLRASVKVDFPRGWITEWYPFAAAAPASRGGGRAPGHSMRWDVKLLAGEPVRFPTERSKNHYYHARETDAVGLEVESAGERGQWLRGGTVVQREKFLFYRGVGTFPTPVFVRALGEGKVRVRNAADGRLGGLVLLSVRKGAVGYQVLGDLEKGAETVATLPAPSVKQADVTDVLVRELTAAGLYDREARAMVKTWTAAWLGEDGTRLLYLVPRTRTDELLPLTVEPKPAEVVRVLVGRHDFLTPEQEVAAELQIQRVRAAQAELNLAEKELAAIGRFAPQARALAEKRLDGRTAKK